MSLSPASLPLAVCRWRSGLSESNSILLLVQWADFILKQVQVYDSKSKVTFELQEVTVELQVQLELDSELRVASEVAVILVVHQ